MGHHHRPLLRPSWELSEALSVTALVHIGGHDEVLTRAVDRLRPAVVVFLDEAAAATSGWQLAVEPHHVRDPHRPGQVYQGWWARRPDGMVVAKAPQHPAANKLYRPEEMHGFLTAVPR